MHIVLCLESESNHIDELLENYPSLYKCTEIIWIPTTVISSPDYIAKELSIKYSVESIPIPKYWNVLDNENVEWSKSPHRFKNLIFTYCALYKNMLTTIQKQQNILQVNVSRTKSFQSINHFNLNAKPIKLNLLRLVLINCHQHMK